VDSRLAVSGSKPTNDPEDLDRLVRLASSKRIVCFAGEFQTGFKNSALCGYYEVVREDINFCEAEGNPTSSQALPTMPFEQQELRPLTHSLLAARALTVVLVRSVFASVFPVSQVAP